MRLKKLSGILNVIMLNTAHRDSFTHLFIFYRWTVVVKYFNLNFTIYRFTAIKCGHNLMIALFDFGKLFTCLTAFFSIG